MFPDDHTRRFIEVANRYNGLAVRAQRQANEQYLRLQPQLNRMAEQVRKLEEGPRHAIIRTFTFARGGWHEAPLIEMTVGGLRKLVDKLVDKPDEEVTKELDQAIPEYFRSNDYYALWDMVDRWDLYPGWREQVFKDAFWAHKNGKYTLSVQALAPQIEGMLRYETKGWLKEINKVLDFQYDPKTPPTIDDLEKTLYELLTKPLPDRYRQTEQVSLEHALFRINELYNSGDFNDPQFVSSLNRHAILHGVAEDFDEIMSVKLFCAVELAHEVVVAFRDVTENDGAGS